MPIIITTRKETEKWGRGQSWEQSKYESYFVDSSLKRVWKTKTLISLQVDQSYKKWSKVRKGMIWKVWAGGGWCWRGATVLSGLLRAKEDKTISKKLSIFYMYLKYWGRPKCPSWLFKFIQDLNARLGFWLTLDLQKFINWLDIKPRAKEMSKLSEDIAPGQLKDFQFGQM